VKFAQLQPPQADEISTLTSYAVLAPSSHNTQPWYFRVANSAVYLYADRTRSLPVNDPDDRELTISCGCAAMNVRIAAAYLGLAAQIQVLPDLQDEDLLAVISFSECPDEVTRDAQLFEFIGKRRTYRKRFKEEDVDESIIHQLQEAAAAENASLQILSQDTGREQAAVLVGEGDAIQWANPSWRRELAAWMHPRRKGDGLTVPWLAAPFAQAVVRTFDMGNGIGAKDGELAKQSPILAVLGTKRDDTADWISAGEALQRVLLTACKNGLQASYLNQPIQVSSLRPKLQQLLPADEFPQLLLRLGYPSEALPATPRRNIREVIDKA
jgi:Nitroreductase family